MLQSQTSIHRFKVKSGISKLESDRVGTEEPLQISLLQGKSEEIFTLTMRTPGDDTKLIYGLLFSEGIINRADEVISLEPLIDSDAFRENRWRATLDTSVKLDLDKINRHQASHAGCGLCGKTSLQALELDQSKPFKPIRSKLDNELIARLKHKLSEQPLFSDTGGVHAAGLIYELEGQLQLTGSPFFEDVGRHNALDKLIGYELVTNDLRQSGVLVLSGRIGFELVQKAIMAGYSVIVALGAPTSMAIQAANQFGLVLIGFAKTSSFNLYTADQDAL